MTTKHFLNEMIQAAIRDGETELALDLYRQLVR